MKSTLFIIIFLTLLKSETFSTPQVSDLLIVGSDTIPLYSLPLGKYLEEKNINTDIFEKFGASTACWRSYRAVWKIQNDSLFLQDLVSCISDTIKIPLKLIFSNHLVNKPIFAYWVIDTLWAEIGNKIFYIHAGWGDFYDKEKCFIVNNGIVISSEIFDYTDKVYISRINDVIFPFSKVYCDKINWNNVTVPEKEIKVLVYQNIDTSYVLRTTGTTNKSYEQEALRIVRDFNPTKLFQHNEKIKIGFSIPIVFSKAIKDDCNK